MTAILFDNNLGGDAQALLLREPVGVVQALEMDDVAPALDRIDRAVCHEGLHAAGFFSYELGYLLEPSLSGLLPEGRDVPLLWFALFTADKVQDLDDAQTAAWLDAQAELETGTPSRISAPILGMSREDYAEKFHRIKQLIAAGDIYQLNLTLPAHVDVEGAPAALYRDLRRRQQVAYGALIETDAFSVLSLSPELFLEIGNGHIVTKPMKGTAPRGRFAAEDETLRQELRRDEKSRAENLMITDLMRNDLGRLSEMASVRVDELFAVETYRTLHQMISTVRARIKPDLSVAGMVKALFPAGSIIGAPKIRAQEIIAALEETPRGIYTGAIGHITPSSKTGYRFDARFNVAIRTLALHREESGRFAGQLGIGGGIVSDSRCAAEWEECVLKMKFLTEDLREFHLIETLKYDFREGYVLLDRHLARLAESARFFEYPCDLAAARSGLEAEAAKHTDTGGASGKALRVRLLLGEDGGLNISSVLIDDINEDPPQVRFVISPNRVDSGNTFLYHKTTKRQFYDEECERLATSTGCDEVLFENERGELTEGSRTNLFIARGDMLLTPPLDAGLLPGTLRAKLLASGEAREATLTRADLKNASRIYLGNSVRGLQEAQALDVRASSRA